MFRTLRVLRPLRSLNAIPRLKSLVSAMISSVPQIVNATIVIFFMFIIFGILMLQVHMQNEREREKERERERVLFIIFMYYDLFLPYFVWSTFILCQAFLGQKFVSVPLHKFPGAPQRHDTHRLHCRVDGVRAQRNCVTRAHAARWKSKRSPLLRSARRICNVANNLSR